MGMDLVSALAANSERLAGLLATHLDNQVPACPDWNGLDLLAHVTMVQRFWTEMTRRAGDQPPDERPPYNPTIDPIEQVRAATRELVEAFIAVDPSAPTWVWWNDARRDTVAASIRRQAHEALIHRVDAEQTAGLASELDSLLAADGVAEFLERMLADVTPSSWAAETGLIEVVASDVEQRWYVRVDDSGARLDETPAGPTLATISGTAADLDLALWRRRGWGSLEFAGDLDAIEALLTAADLS